MYYTLFLYFMSYWNVCGIFLVFFLLLKYKKIWFRDPRQLQENLTWPCFFLFLLTMFSSTVVSKVQKQPPEVFCKNAVLRNFTIFTGKHLCSSLFLIKLHANLFKKGSNTGVSCEYYEIRKNTYFEKHLRTTASTN